MEVTVSKPNGLGKKHIITDYLSPVCDKVKSREIRDLLDKIGYFEQGGFELGLQDNEEHLDVGIQLSLASIHSYLDQYWPKTSDEFKLFIKANTEYRHDSLGWVEFDLRKPRKNQPKGIPSIFIQPNKNKAGLAVPKTLSAYATRIVQRGIMFSRSLAYERFCLAFESNETLQQCLDQLHWSGNRDDIARFFELTEKEVLLSVNFSQERPMKTIGVEIYPDEDHTPIISEGWGRALDFLVEIGACTERNEAFLRSWPCYQKIDNARWHVPKGWEKTIDFVKQRYSPVYASGLHHFKVVMDPNGIEEVKAYFGFEFSWIQ